MALLRSLAAATSSPKKTRSFWPIALTYSFCPGVLGDTYRPRGYTSIISSGLGSLTLDVFRPEADSVPMIIAASTAALSTNTPERVFLRNSSIAAAA